MPPPNTFKLDFDCALKGNPRPAEFGGVIRNFEGQIQGVLWGSLGYSTNNTAELERLFIGTTWDIK